jgi:transcriptional antiterminator RfaH
MSDSIYTGAGSSGSGFQSERVNLSCEDESCDVQSNWYAVWTRSRQEKASAERLNALGIQHYLPLKSELRQWSDRKQIVEVPLFIGYLFVCINLLTNSQLRILKVPGIVAFVRNNAGPSPIPDEQIEDIRTVLTARVDCSAHQFLSAGDRVRVVKGPLAGVEGTLERTTSTSRLVISIEMIRQSLSVNILREDVEPVCARSLIAMHVKQSSDPLGSAGTIGTIVQSSVRSVSHTGARSTHPGCERQ